MEHARGFSEQPQYGPPFSIGDVIQVPQRDYTVEVFAEIVEIEESGLIHYRHLDDGWTSQFVPLDIFKYRIFRKTEAMPWLEEIGIEEIGDISDPGPVIFVRNANGTREELGWVRLNHVFTLKKWLRDTPKPVFAPTFLNRVRLWLILKLERT